MHRSYYINIYKRGKKILKNNMKKAGKKVSTNNIQYVQELYNITKTNISSICKDDIEITKSLKVDCEKSKGNIGIFTTITAILVSTLIFIVGIVANYIFDYTGVVVNKLDQIDDINKISTVYNFISKGMNHYIIDTTLIGILCLIFMLIGVAMTKNKINYVYATICDLEHELERDSEYKLRRDLEHDLEHELERNLEQLIIKSNSICNEYNDADVSTNNGEDKAIVESNNEDKDNIVNQILESFEHVNSEVACTDSKIELINELEELIRQYKESDKKLYGIGNYLKTM